MQTKPLSMIKADCAAIGVVYRASRRRGERDRHFKTHPSIRPTDEREIISFSYSPSPWGYNTRLARSLFLHPLILD